VGSRQKKAEEGMKHEEEVGSHQIVIGRRSREARGMRKKLAVTREQ